MAQVNFNYGTNSAIKKSTVTNGRVYVTSDTNQLYVDLDDTRHLITTEYEALLNVPATFPPSEHTHDASDIISGIFNIARIPDIDAAKITSGTISIDRLPAGALERLVSVTDEAARFNLTTDDVQLGDTVQELDTGAMFIVVDTSKLSSEDGYVEYTAKSASSVPWSGITNKPTLSFTPSGTISTTSITPVGTISKPTFSGTNKIISVSGTPSGTVVIKQSATSSASPANYTPEGTIEEVEITPSGIISTPTFTGVQEKLNISLLPIGTNTSTDITPSGVIGAPSDTVDIKEISDVGTLPSLTGSVTDNILSFTFDPGTLPEQTSVTVANSEHIHTFTGNTISHTHTFTGLESSTSISFTPEGTISTPSFTGSTSLHTHLFAGTGALLTGAFSGSLSTFTGEYTPEGSVSQPIFTGTTISHSHDFVGSNATINL